MTAQDKAEVAASVSPDDALAEEIVSALVDAKLMDAAKAASIRKKVAAGEMDQGDWTALVEFKRPDAKGNSNG